MAPDPARPLTAADVERGLDRGDLRVHYQPCYDLRTGEIIAVEALVRLHDPESGGLHAPDSFLGAIEQTAVVSRLDAMVFAAAADQVARWRALPGGRRLCLAVNLSAADLDDTHLPEQVQEVAERAGLPLDAVIVELTETLLSRTGQGHEEVLSRLGALGCNITLDDFGTGNASFDYLRRFHVDGIKIDRSFVHFLGSGAPHERMAESLVRFCLSLGVHVVAEGIEEPRQVAALRRLGCPFGQGFLMSRPLDPAALEALLEGGVATSLALEHRPDAAVEPTPHLRPEPRRRRTSDRFGTRVLAALVCTALVAIAGIAVVGRQNSEASLAHAAQRRLEAVDSLAARQVDTQVAGLRDVVTTYTRGDAVRRALRTHEPELVRVSLDALGSATEDIHSTSLYDASGTLLALAPTAPDLVGRNFAYRDWYQGARASEGAYVSEAFQLLTGDKPWAVAVSAAVRDDAGRTEGYVVATMTLSALQAELDDVLDRYGVGVTLVDFRGTTLAAPGAGVGRPSDDPRLASGRGGASASATGPLWAVREVPAVGGWLLAEQPRRDALSGADQDGRAGLVLILLVVGAALLFVLVWLRSDRRRVRLEKALGEANTWLTSIMGATPTPLVVTDASDVVQLANPAAAALLGVPLESLAGQTLASWLPTRDHPDRDGGAYQASVVTTEGDVRLVEVHPQVVGSPRGELFHLHALIDVTPHRREQDRLRAEGRVDPLTGVGNRVALQEALTAALAPGPSSYALLMLDLDGFKGVNDLLGHAVGDSLLCAVAEVLVEAVHGRDSVARIGGDEFAVVVRLGDAAPPDAVAEGLRVRVQRAIDGHPSADRVAVGVSVGLALVGVDGNDASGLLHLADVRMYEVKRDRHRQRSRVVQN